MLYPDVIHNDRIWRISICKESTTLMSSQKLSGFMHYIAMLFAYIYVEILSCFVVLSNDGYTILLILIRWIDQVVPLQGGNFLVFASHLVLETHFLILDDLDPAITICDSLLQRCCPLVMLFVDFCNS